MAGKVCVGCGLTTDTNGNLIVATSGTVGDVTGSTCTAASSGTHIYCDATTGKLYGPPEKFSQFNRIGKNFVTNVATRMTILVPSQDGQLHDISSEGLGTATAADKTPLVFTVPNPSKCLPFNIYMEAGISHCYVHYEGNPGNFTFEASAFVTVTGVTQPFTGHTGHQIWAYDTHGNHGEIVFDSMGARETVDPLGAATKFVILPGGTMTVKLNPYVSVDINGTSTVADIMNLTMDVNWWGSND